VLKEAEEAEAGRRARVKVCRERYVWNDGSINVTKEARGSQYDVEKPADGTTEEWIRPGKRCSM